MSPEMSVSRQAPAELPDFRSGCQGSQLISSYGKLNRSVMQPLERSAERLPLHKVDRSPFAQGRQSFLPSEQCCADTLERPEQQVPQKASASSKFLVHAGKSSDQEGPGVALEGREKTHDLLQDGGQPCYAISPQKAAPAVGQDGNQSCPPPPKAATAARPFHDRSFPASQSSLGREDLDVEWLRVQDLEATKGNLMLFGEINADNFVQGDLGNCWLLAAMASLTDYPGHIMELFSPRQYSPEGRYEVRLYDIQKGWCTVVIDDRIPCNDCTHLPCFSSLNDGAGFWPLLLEKACAKFCGSYARLDGGSQAWAYQVLTGVVQQKIYEKENRILFGSCWQEYPTSVMMQSLRPDKWRREGMQHIPKTVPSLVGRAVGVTPHFSAQSFFKQVAYYEQCGFLISASVEGKRRDRQQDRPDGLFIDHAYAVLKLQNVHGVRMVKLRNPWGAVEWHGRFSRQSHAWHECPDLVRDLCPDLGEEPTGEFWMAWEDFESIFTDVNVSPGCLPVPRQPQRLPEGQGAMPQCGKCCKRGDRRWCMTDLDVDDGKWVRLKSGDFCLACRRSCRGQFRFENDIAGIDTFLAHPQPKLPTAPSEKPLCQRGPGCCDQSPEHFAALSHPWLTAPPPKACITKGEKPSRANSRRRRAFTV